MVFSTLPNFAHFYDMIDSMSAAMTKEQILQDLRKLKPRLASEYKVVRMGLFGSWVRNEARADSDIDVVVELAEPDLFAIVHIKEELEADFQKSVDVIPFSPMMNSFMRQRIAAEAVYV